MSTLYINFGKRYKILNGVRDAREELEDIQALIDGAINELSGENDIAPGTICAISNLEAKYDFLTEEISKLQEFCSSYSNFLAKAEEIDGNCKVFVNSNEGYPTKISDV